MSERGYWPTCASGIGCEELRRRSCQGIGSPTVTFESGRNTCSEPARARRGARRAGGSNMPGRACHGTHHASDTGCSALSGNRYVGLRMPQHTFPAGWEVTRTVRRPKCRVVYVWSCAARRMEDFCPAWRPLCRVVYVRSCATRRARPGATVFRRYLSGFACRGIQDAHAQTGTMTKALARPAPDTQVD